MVIIAIAIALFTLSASAEPLSAERRGIKRIGRGDGMYKKA
jgi:hypothetical protein